jgi:hypothetical protein
MQPQSATGIALGGLILQALNEGGKPSTDPASAESVKIELSQKIAAAIEQYVEAKLTALATQLVLPTAYVGAGPTGPVVINPGTIGSYNPKLP